MDWKVKSSIIPGQEYRKAIAEVVMKDFNFEIS